MASSTDPSSLPPSSTSSASSVSSTPPTKQSSQPTSRPPRAPRSTTGCHTCRLRKKKCDEARPICSSCSSRNIPCYGYGERPEWMEGVRRGGGGIGRTSERADGDEGAFVRIVKKAAERSYRARRRGWDPSYVDGVAFGIGEEAVLGKGNSEGIPEVELDLMGIEMMEEMMGDGAAYDLSQASQVMMMTAYEDGGCPTPPVDMEAHLWTSGTSDSLPSSTTTTPPSMTWPPSPPLSLQFRTAPRKEDDSDQENTSATKAVASLRNQCCRRLTSSHSHTKSQSRSKYQHPFILTSPSISSQTALTAPFPQHNHPHAVLHNTTHTELDLLSHYLDRVFFLQYGFSDLKPSTPPSSTRLVTAATSTRAWYLSMLVKCQPLYFATLGISALHSALVLNGSAGVEELKFEVQKNFGKTLKGLQSVIDDFQGQGLSGVQLLKERWHVLGTMCQLMSLEVFSDLGGNWLVHLRAARRFVSMIGSSSFTPAHSILTCRNSRCPKRTTTTPLRSPRLDILEQVLNDKSHHVLSTNDTTALKHYATSVVWGDIVSRASGIDLPLPKTGTTTLQVFNYLPLLENHTLDLSCVMGCENWVFVGIAQVVMLESELRDLRSQSTRILRDDRDELDFSSRKAVLELMFEQGIEDLQIRRQEMVTELERHSSLVTEIFALAALVYLHVTVSGAFPWLPQVRSVVGRAVDLLEVLPLDLLIRISWPFAVIGCMVLDEKQDVMRGFRKSAEKLGINTGTVWKGMIVAEECWRLRGVKVGAEASWVHAMESLNEKILLC